MDLSFLLMVFSLILTLASKLLHPYSTDDKTSKLMVKNLFTMRDTQRGSQSYMEKRRKRKEIEVTRRRRGSLLLLYVFSYEKLCHYHRQIILIYVCPWEELSSGSSYSVI